MDLGIAGKRALVTGASIGIGRAIALALAKEGVKLAVAARRRALLEGLQREAGVPLVIIEQDFLAAEAPKRIADAALKGLGAIDILVNNAGVYEFAPLEAITPEHFHKQFDLNVLGLLLVSGEAARHFNANGGSIINISSAASTLAPPNGAVYSATKASVDAISAVLAKELAPRKIRVNAVNPGMIVTEGVVAAGLHEGDMRKWIESTTLLGRVGEAAEIAAAVAFFASNDASYITGETLHVTGGLR